MDKYEWWEVGERKGGGGLSRGRTLHKSRQEPKDEPEQVRHETDGAGQVAQTADGAAGDVLAVGPHRADAVDQEVPELVQGSAEGLAQGVFVEVLEAGLVGLDEDVN